jgi:Response regulator containing CheY-like receiver, AAA-type ATPase, and DNA-binding domains
MNMPDMSGSELAQRILKIRPNMPILILTGFSELIDKEISISMGIKEYIMKPFTKMKLAKTLRKVLDSNVISVK